MENIAEHSISQKVRSPAEQTLVIRISDLIERINSEKRTLIIDPDHLKLNTEK